MSEKKEPLLSVNLEGAQNEHNFEQDYVIKNGDGFQAETQILSVPLPSLSYNNVTNGADEVTSNFVFKLSGYDKKCCEMVFKNASALLENRIPYCAFFTITTPQNLSYWNKDGWQEARKRFRSFVSHKTGMEKVFGSKCNWMRVIEPQKRGAIHWHVLVDTGMDIRTGVDFEAFKRKDYRSASPALRGIWSRMRDVAKKYKLGRCEIMPIRVDAYEATARYVAKYLSKTIKTEVNAKRDDYLKRPEHSRRIGFSVGWRVATSRFAWLGDSADTWRRGVQIFHDSLFLDSYEDFKKVLGVKWAWNNRKYIMALGADFLGCEECALSEPPRSQRPQADSPA